MTPKTALPKILRRMLLRSFPLVVLCSPLCILILISLFNLRDVLNHWEQWRSIVRNPVVTDALVIRGTFGPFSGMYDFGILVEFKDLEGEKREARIPLDKSTYLEQRFGSLTKITYDQMHPENVTLGTNPRRYRDTLDRLVVSSLVLAAALGLLLWFIRNRVRLTITEKEP